MKTNTTKSHSTTKTRLVCGCGMLAAAATALQYLEIPSPVNFIALDFSDLPALIGAFAYGPVAGVLIELIKNIIVKLHIRRNIHCHSRNNLQKQKE